MARGAAGDAHHPLDLLSAAAERALRRLAAGHSAADRRASVAIAVSGGLDSIALLDVFAHVASELGVTLRAVHVHHGLSPNADRWAAFCEDQCRKRGVPLTVVKVSVQRQGGKSLEATARAERYRALSRLDVDAVVLAHHADDQAETLLLQLLRGAGPRGLAAMPSVRSGDGPALLRPWLDLPRALIESYARERGLVFVDDESNLDRTFKRNYLRHEIAPRLSAAFPGYPHTLVRAAAHNAEARELMDELAALDARGACTLDRDDALVIERAAMIALAQASMARARNLLRWFLTRHGLVLPSAARLDEMLSQLLTAAPDRRVRLAHNGAELGIFRGHIVVHGPPVAPFLVEWSGQRRIELPHGELEFKPMCGEGIAAARLQSQLVTIRQRRGRERLRLANGGHSRSVKHLLQDAGIAPWRRAALPFVYCGDALAAVADVGIDAAFRAAPGAPGFALAWHPRM